MSVSIKRLSEYSDNGDIAHVEQLLVGARVHYGFLHHQYEVEYLGSQGYQVTDESVIIRLGSRVIGIFYILVLQNEVTVTCSKDGSHITLPYLVDGLESSTIRSVIKALLRHVGDLCYAHNVPNVVYRIDSVDYYQEFWLRELVPKAKSLIPICKIRLKLARSLSEIVSGYRKSYKSLINEGRRLWDVSIMDGTLDENVWKEYEEFHLHVAGRKTRSPLSWQIQGEMLSTGQAFLVLIRQRTNGSLVGGAFVQYSRYDAMYSVGVYDRTLFEYPLGHVVQDCVIRYLVEKGIAEYYLGDYDFFDVNEKTVNISRFKLGFSDELAVSLTVNL